MAGFPIRQKDFKFKIVVEHGYAELQTTTRQINCEVFESSDKNLTPQRYIFIIPYLWNVTPEEHAYSMNAIFKELGKQGFGITSYQNEKPKELIIKAVR